MFRGKHSISKVLDSKLAATLEDPDGEFAEEIRGGATKLIEIQCDTTENSFVL